MGRRRKLITRVGTAAAAVAVAAATLTAVQAASADKDGKEDFRGDLMTLNDSGVTGQVRIVDEDGELRVKVDARGVEDMQMHMSHIHGHGAMSQASCPDMGAAGDDNILTIGEGFPAYGPVFVTVANDHVSEPRLRFDRTFTMTDATSPIGQKSVGELGSLGRYVIVVHGMTLADNPDTPAQDPGYVASLPVACAEVALR